ncbi:FxLYD domain-containing protein [Sporosarcina sp. NPDC096371]|uniref:FxLYD domain-containing protein n=1 Tax=Sporosarcina sp. NPDC096371 TaxID=3364530 RepID=UPI00382C2E8D
MVNYVDVQGYVKNIGDVDYYYVDVKISLRNENGDVLDTYNTYAVDGVGIATNERKSFDATLYHAAGTTRLFILCCWL